MTTCMPVSATFGLSHTASALSSSSQKHAPSFKLLVAIELNKYIRSF